jgi:hypothetical protein
MSIEESLFEKEFFGFYFDQ